MNLDRPPEPGPTPPTPTLPTDPREISLQAAIAADARALWVGYGRPAGRDLDIWLEAERQLLGADQDVVRIGAGAVATQTLNEAVGRPATPA